jgi:hypothetical protein
MDGGDDGSMSNESGYTLACDSGLCDTTHGAECTVARGGSVGALPSDSILRAIVAIAWVGGVARWRRRGASRPAE